ncbi:thioesterase family protein [Micrococcus sp. FDAARGOS_333]|uniref:acyl-CoA thioesterase n=1 Tax=Micrococcus sp. FDAARGOS_333 TaxID=1930558 RepID=UPI000B4DFCCF|nr:thioesterase family protein [Micrococcus sp. FDAARGOS_333]PNL17391.1 acyl-CoA thioesterase [Micrococcus sp. FDAARGOS_333]
MTAATPFLDDDGRLAVDVYVPLRWKDMDAYGHINNIQVVQLMEEARVAAFGVPVGSGSDAEAGPAPLDLTAGAGEGVRAFVSEHRVKYRAQMKYRAKPVRVRVSVDEVKGASVHVGYKMHDGVDDALLVTATSVMVYVDAETGRPMRLTDEQKKALTGGQ